MSDGEIFLGAIDQGTTSSRFLIFDKQGEPIASHQEEFKQIYPKPGWHEHDPEELVSSVNTCIDEAVKKFTSKGHNVASIKAVGITNQRETTVVWDRKTGKALHNAIVWTDTRTGSIVTELKQRSGSDKLQEVCGEPISTYPSVVKLLWLLKHVPEVQQAYERGDLAFGTVDSWLIYRLNGGPGQDEVHVSDATNASRTMFMDIRLLKYSDKHFDFFGYEFDFRKVAFPKIVASSDPDVFGRLASGSLKGHKITGCLGDQSAALVGQKGFQAGSAKNTYGTGCFLLYNVGASPVISHNGLLSTVAYDFGKDMRAYALEGSIAVAGSGVKFLVNNMGFSPDSESITHLASSVPDSGGLVFVTAFSGLFAPYWISDAQGTMFGITQHTQPAHIARATLEAVTFQTKAILDAMSRDSHAPLTSLYVDGGMSASDLTMQTQADVTGIPIVRPRMRETTCLGAAIAAGLAVGVWGSLEDVGRVNREGEEVFERKIGERKAERMVARWERAVEMTRGWVRDEDAEA